jgi:hypothetical protein
VATVTDRPDRYRHFDPEFLRLRYVDQGMTAKAIAGELGANQATVRRALTRNGIATRPRMSATATQRLADGAWLRQQFLEKGRIAGDIARDLGISPARLTTAFQQHKIPTDRPVMPVTRERQRVSALARRERELQELRQYNREVEQANEARKARAVREQRIRDERRAQGRCRDCSRPATDQSARCPLCLARQQKRNRERHAGGVMPAREPRAPTNQPAVIVRKALAAHRRDGIGFDRAWSLALAAVRPGPAVREQLQWARPAFKDGYLGVGKPMALASMETESVDRW